MGTPPNNVISSTGFMEAEGSPRETGGVGESPAVTRTFIGPAATRFDFIQELFGTTTPCTLNTDSSTPTEVIYVPPIYYPPSGWTGAVTPPAPPYTPPNTTSIRPWRFRGRPARGNGPAQVTSLVDSNVGSDCEWEWEIDYIFEPWPGRQPYGLPDPLPGTFFEVNDTSNLEVLQVPGRLFEWDRTETGHIPPVEDVTLHADDSPGINLINKTFDLTWRHVVSPPWACIQQANGTVNEKPFLGYPPESVMFVSPDTAYSYEHSGVLFYDLHYLFLVKVVRVEGANPYKDVGASEIPPGCNPDDDCSLTLLGRWNRSFTKYSVDSPGCPGSYHPWRRIQEQGTEAPPFPLFDFARLFQYGCSACCEEIEE